MQCFQKAFDVLTILDQDEDVLSDTAGHLLPVSARLMPDDVLFRTTRAARVRSGTTVTSASQNPPHASIRTLVACGMPLTSTSMDGRSLGERASGIGLDGPTMTGWTRWCLKDEPMDGLVSGRFQTSAKPGRPGDRTEPRIWHATGMSKVIGGNLNVEGVSLWFASASFAGTWRSWP